MHRNLVFYSDEHFYTFFSDIFFQLQNLEKKSLGYGVKKEGRSGNLHYTYFFYLALVITEEIIFDQNKLSKDPNNHFKTNGKILMPDFHKPTFRMSWLHLYQIPNIY